MANKINIEKCLNPKRWKLLDQIINKQQSTFTLGHLNPEVYMDFEKGARNKIIKTEVRGNITETTSTYGIITKKGKRADFYDGMIMAIESGLISKFTVKDIQDMRDRANKVLPEEYDLNTDITVINYREETVAAQMLENFSTQFTKGLAETTIPGTPDEMTFGEMLKNPLIIAEMEKQGHSEGEINKIAELLKKASSQMLQNTQKINAKFELGKFHQYPAVYFMPPINSKTPKKEINKNRTIEGANSSRTTTKVQASGGFDDRVKFPPNAFKKEEVPVGGKILQAIHVKNFLISGGLLPALHYAPSGQSFCQSLTKFKTVSKVSHSDGKTFIDHLIVPLHSCLEKEGYMNREEIEMMILKLISLLQEN